MQTQDVDSRKPAFRWLGVSSKCHNVVESAEPLAVKPWNKRSFGSDLTNANAELKKTKMNPVADENPRKVMKRTDDIRQCNMTAQRQLQVSKTYSFGPFLPLVGLKYEEDTEADDKRDSSMNEWEDLASSFRLQYHNQGTHNIVFRIKF